MTLEQLMHSCTHALDVAVLQTEGAGFMTTEHDTEIRINHLFSHFLRRWKSILVVTVICAAVLGGWQYFSIKKTHDAGAQTKEEARYAQELADFQEKLKNAQENVEESTAICEDHKAYRQNSILMNLDPNNVWIAEKNTGSAARKSPLRRIFWLLTRELCRRIMIKMRCWRRSEPITRDMPGNW